MQARAPEREGGGTPPRRRRWKRRLVGAGLVLLLLVLGAGLALQRDPTPRILALRGELAGVRDGPPLAASAHVDQELVLTSTGGLEVELRIRRPDDGGETPRPAVVILGGHRTGRGAAELIPDTHGIVVVALSYPTRLTRIERPRDLLEVRRAILGTPAAVMLCADYLATRPFVDPARVELVGVSLGAPFVCVAGALDPRFVRVWSIHGGGAPARLFEAALQRELSITPVRKLAARAITLLSHGTTLAPEDWVARIAPRPFVMINAADDEAIPRACVDVLYAAAVEPKELVWISGGHIEKSDEAQIAALCELVLERME